MQVRKILAIKGTALYTIASSASVADAIAVMAEQDIGSLVCVDAGHMVGMLTFRELLKAMHRLGPAAGSARIASIMQADNPPGVMPPSITIHEPAKMTPMIMICENNIPIPAACVLPCVSVEPDSALASCNRS